MEFICTEFNKIKSKISRTMNKQLYPDVNSYWWNPGMNQNIKKQKEMKAL